MKPFPERQCDECWRDINEEAIFHKIIGVDKFSCECGKKYVLTKVKGGERD